MRLSPLPKDWTFACSACKHFDREHPHLDARDHAACRRYPPTADSTGTWWPVVASTNICGEFSRRNGE
jgi:hypothetical protein